MRKGLIKFHYLTKDFLFKERQRVKIFLFSLFTSEEKHLEVINYIFCNDDFLLNLNQEFLKHDTYTDIITFQFTGLTAPLLSDIYISTDRIKENSLIHTIPFQRELLRVMIHGALHLCGYDDKTVGEKNIMSQKEDEYLGKYSVSRGTR